MKNKWRNYALKDGKIQSSYIREYCNRKKVRKTGETSNCHSNEQSGKEQVEEEVKLVYREGLAIKMDPIILNDDWVINLNKEDKHVTDRRKSDEKRPRGNEESTGSFLAMQDLSEKQPNRKRKKAGAEGSSQGFETK